MVRDKAIVKSLVKVKDYRKRNQKHSTNIKSNLQSINTPNENTTTNGTIFPNIKSPSSCLTRLTQSFAQISNLQSSRVVSKGIVTSPQASRYRTQAIEDLEEEVGSTPKINISNSNILSSVKNGQTNQREPSEERVDASVTLSQKRQAQTTKLS